MFSSGRNLAALENERRKYDEFLAYADAEFGRLMETLAERGDLENTIFIFVSDHGELFERGIIGHTTAGLYHPVIQVPLMIRLPGQKTRQDIYTPTSNTDLLPTLLHLTGQAVPGWCEGQVLPPWQTSASADRPIFSVEAKSSPFQGPLVKRSISMVSGEYKLVHYHGYEEAPDRWELYDLAEDPEELRELTSASPEVTRRLQERLLAEFQSAEHRNNNT
jgi:arylsulfatase A-like enzyme